MSKSLGNSPDLLALIDKYGADAVRFGIMISSPAGNDLLWDESSNEQGLHFNNKIWNALKLVKMWEDRLAPVSTPAAKENFAVKWFDNRLREARAEIEELYKDFRLSEILKTIYSLIWNDFCSWYLEWVKPSFVQRSQELQGDDKASQERPSNNNDQSQLDPFVYQKTIEFFEQLMQLLHPFMPFVTEEIYQQLRKQETDLTIKQYPGISSTDTSILQTGQLLQVWHC